MRRGTTQPITADVDTDLTGLGIHLSFTAGPLIVKTESDMDVTYDGEKTTLETTLTQAETLSMLPGACKVQLRAFNADGSLALATDSQLLEVLDVEEEGFLPSLEE